MKILLTLFKYKIYDKSLVKNSIKNEKIEYSSVLKKIKDDELNTITINNEKLKIFNLFWWRLGWLGTYIIVSIITSMLLRKLLKVY